MVRPQMPVYTSPRPSGGLPSSKGNLDFLISWHTRGFYERAATLYHYAPMRGKLLPRILHQPSRFVDLRRSMRQHGRGNPLSRFARDLPRPAHVGTPPPGSLRSPRRRRHCCRALLPGTSGILLDAILPCRRQLAGLCLRLGVIYAYWYEKSGSLLPSIIGHNVGNLVEYLLAF